MMDFARFARLDDEPRLHAQSLADQVMVHRPGCQGGRDRHPVRRDRPVRQNEHVDVRQHRLGRFPAEPLQRRLERLAAATCRPGCVERGGAEGAVHRIVDRPDLLEILVGEDRLRDFQPLEGAGMMTEQVGARPDHGDERHHHGFADRIDRRVGDLREVLLEIIVEQLGPFGENRDGGVRSHRSDRIVALGRHRRQEQLQILLGIAERLLAAAQSVRIGRARLLLRGRQLFELELRVPQPFAIRLGIGELRLDLRVLDDAALLQVDEQHLAGLEPPLADDLFLRDRKHAAFGRHDDAVVFGHREAGGAETISIERGTDLPPVGKGDRGRTVPRLHQRGVIFVKGAPRCFHLGVAGPGFRDQHHHRVRQRIAAGDQQLERIVEARRVGLAVRDERPHLV